MTEIEREELLKEAQIRFPPGTVYVPAHVMDNVDKSNEAYHNTVIGNQYHIAGPYGYVDSKIGSSGYNHCIIQLMVGGGVKWAYIVSKGEKKIDAAEDLIKQAGKLYPIGTKYRDVGPTNNMKVLTSGRKPEWVKVDGKGIEVGIGYIYWNGRWAEIVKEEQKKDEFPYKAGDWIKVSNFISSSKWPSISRIIKIEDDATGPNHRIWIKREDGVEDWFDKGHIERRATEQEIKEATAPKTLISAFGMNVGDKLLVKDLDSWSKLPDKKNEWTSMRGWYTASQKYNTDRAIEKIEEKERIMAYLVRGTSNIWIRAEGYKEFCQNRNKQPDVSCIPIWEAEYSKKEPKTVWEYMPDRELLSPRWEETVKSLLKYYGGVDPYKEQAKGYSTVFDKREVSKEALSYPFSYKVKEDIEDYLQTPVVIRKTKKSGIIFVQNQY